MKFSLAVHPLTESLMRLFYPSYCHGCQAFMGLEESMLCSSCQRLFQKSLYCGQDRICVPRNSLSHVWSLAAYEGLAKDLIGQIKFSKDRRLLRLFDHPLKETLLQISSFTRYDLVIPIPMERSKLLLREYALVSLIAKRASKCLMTPFQSKLLAKQRPTLPQSSLNKKERLINVMNAFRITHKSLVKKHVLLVDDIYTTGATADNAAKTLKQYGAERVDLLTLARTDQKA